MTRTTEPLTQPLSLENNRILHGRVLADGALVVAKRLKISLETIGRALCGVAINAANRTVLEQYLVTRLHEEEEARRAARRGTQSELPHVRPAPPSDSIRLLSKVNSECLGCGGPIRKGDTWVVWVQGIGATHTDEQCLAYWRDHRPVAR